MQIKSQVRPRVKKSTTRKSQDVDASEQTKRRKPTKHRTIEQEAAALELEVDEVLEDLARSQAAALAATAKPTRKATSARRKPTGPGSKSRRPAATGRRP